MLKTRNFNAQSLFQSTNEPKTLDTAGVSAGHPFKRVSQETTFPTPKPVFAFTLLFVTCQNTLAARGRGQLLSDTPRCASEYRGP